MKKLRDYGFGTWREGDGDGPQMREEDNPNGKPFLRSTTKLKKHHFDISNPSNWGYVNDKGVRTVTPHRVNPSDQVVFWSTLFLTQDERHKAYPSAFDKHGDIRVTRLPQDPPMVIEAHGLHWHPMWKGASILCGSDWRAMGWMFDKCVNRTTGGLPIPKEWSVGLVLASPDAVARAGWVLKLDEDSLPPLPLQFADPEVANPDPENLLEAARQAGIGINFRRHPNAKCWVILNRDEAALQYQDRLRGWQTQAGATEGSSYQTYTGSQPLPPVDWSKIKAQEDLKHRISFKKRKRNAPKAKDLIRQPTGAITTTPERSSIQAAIAQALSSPEAGPAIEALLGMNILANLHASVSQSPKALELSRLGWRKEQVQYLRNLIDPSPACQEVNRWLAAVSTAERRHLVDYFAWKEGVHHIENDVDHVDHATMSPSMRDAVANILESLEHFPPSSSTNTTHGDGTNTTHGDSTN